VRVTFDKSIIAASIDAIVCADAEGKIILWNRAAETMFGYTEQEALGQPVTILMREEDRAAHLAGVRHFLKTGKPHRLIGKVTETFGVRKDGTIFSKEMSLAAEKVEGKWVFTAIMRDITERKQVEATLLHRKNQLQSLLDASLIINTNLDPQAIRKALIHTACKLMNAESGTAGLFEDGRMIFREYRRGDQWETLDYTFEPGFGVPGHIMQTKKPYISNDAEHDAHVVPKIRQALGFHQLIDVPVLNHSGELLGCFEVHDPVDGRLFNDTDIKLLEGLASSAAVALENVRMLEEHEQHLRELRDSEAHFRALFQHANDAIFLVDPKHDRIIDANARASEMLEYSHEELLATPMSTIQPEEMDRAMAFAEQVFAEGSGWTDELTCTTRSGHAVSAEISASLFTRGGKSYMLAIVRDISERRQMERMLRAIVKSAEEATGQAFFASIIKCLCTLLNADCVIVGEITQDRRVRALAMQCDGNSIPHYEYDISGTPCENVAAKGYCEYPEHLRDLFPDDQVLVDLQVESYAGIPIRDRQGHAIGILCALFRGKLNLPNHAREVFELIASRVGAEIGREYADAALQQRVDEAEKTRQSMLYMLEDLNESKGHIERAKQEWEATFDAVTDPVFLHDRDGNIMRANKAYAEEVCIGKHDITGRPYWQAFPVLDGPMQTCLRAWETKKAEEEEEEEEEEFRMPDGRIFISHSYAVKDEKGGYAYSVHFMQDITERKQAAERLRKNLEGTIKTIASAVEARDPYTAGHQVRVAKLACAIAKEMELDADRAEGIHWGAMIHDIGKIHLPAEILSKPTRLSDLEYTLIKSHPQVGYDILRGIEFPWPVADIVHQHHERLDGSGYPQGLDDGKICLEARIVAVADVVEAMSSHRPYRPGLGIDKALAEITRGRGKQYDPQVADACLELFNEGTFSFGEKGVRNLY